MLLPTWRRGDVIVLLGCGKSTSPWRGANLLRHRRFGYGHSFGILSHYFGREAGLVLRKDVNTVLEPGVVVSMEPMLTIPEGEPGAGGYREHDFLTLNGWPQARTPSLGFQRGRGVFSVQTTRNIATDVRCGSRQHERTELMVR